jgi:hypothetical protein
VVLIISRQALVTGARSERCVAGVDSHFWFFWWRAERVWVWMKEWNGRDGLTVSRVDISSLFEL